MWRRAAGAGIAIIAVPAPAAAATPTAPATHADATEQADTDTEIVVTGYGSATSRVLSANALHDAAEAYRKHRATFARQAPLRFEVRGINAPPLLFAKGAERIPVELDAERRFALPARVATETGWRIVGKGKRGGQTSIRPAVFSPHSRPTDWRLGDARLGCRVYWAMVGEDLNLALRVMVGALGPCSSKRFALMIQPPPGTTTVAVTDGATTLPLPLTGTPGHYRLPLHDKRLSHEARIRAVSAAPADAR